MEQRASRSTFVLVHGSFVSSWCWRDVVSELQRRGHRAITLDLPAHGADRTPAERVTMSDYVDAVRRVVEAQASPPILVGHSIGGMICAGVAESAPTAVAAIVFVAGLLPPSGSTPMQAVTEFDPNYLAQVVWAPDRRTAWISPEGVRDFPCALCPAAIVDEVVRRMTPEPVAPYEAPLVTSEARFGIVPRYYVETLRDRVVPLSMQRAIQARAGFRRVLSLDTDHFPALSAPMDLAACLDAVAADVPELH